MSLLLSAHETATGITHEFASLSQEQSVQQLLSTERHGSIFDRLKANLSTRSRNLLLACSMQHASDWLRATDPGPWPWHAIGGLPHGAQVSSGSASLYGTFPVPI